MIALWSPAIFSGRPIRRSGRGHVARTLSFRGRRFSKSWAGFACSRSSNFGLEEFTLVQVARKVVGVGSVGTRAWVLLMDAGDGDEPLFLQAKEAQPSVLAEYCGGSQYANQGERVVAGQHRRPPRLRLRLPAGRPARHRSQPAALPGAAGLRRSRHRRPVPAHPGRAGHRGGQPQRPADPGRRPRRLRRPGRPGLPDRLLLAPLLAGPPAYLLFRHRYGRPAPRRATPGDAGSTA